MSKIIMENPIVEMDGDEMARVVWRWIKQDLLEPFIELKTIYIDLGIKNRDSSNDLVTHDAVEALKYYKVGVKCPTITPNKERVKEYNLKNNLQSPNAILRSRLKGTIFRTPFLVKRIKPLIMSWHKPIIIARHGVGDIYEATEIETTIGDKFTILLNDKIITSKDIETKRVFLVYSVDAESITNFAKSVFNYALERKLDVWFSAKDTISKRYDGMYKEIFDWVFDSEFKDKFMEKNISYYYYLIDDAYARAAKSTGGFLWALKNYDGDIASDFVLTSFSGSIALSFSELYSPEGIYYSEASHGTVQKHYYRYLRGEPPSTNPIGLILAWAKALERRATLDKNEELLHFSIKLVETLREVIDVCGYGTPDISSFANPPLITVSTTDFIRIVRKRLEENLS